MNDRIKKPLLAIFGDEELWKDDKGKLQKCFRDDVEKAIDAYECQLCKKHNGKKYRANYARRMIRDHGGIEALSRSVRDRKKLQTGFVSLKKAGKIKLSFEAIVVRHASLFNDETVKNANCRLKAVESVPDNWPADNPFIVTRP